jgi:hypothetical protein
MTGPSLDQRSNVVPGPRRIVMAGKDSSDRFVANAQPFATVGESFLVVALCVSQ